jgi:hypothetical protein
VGVVGEVAFVVDVALGENVVYPPSLVFGSTRRGSFGCSLECDCGDMGHCELRTPFCFTREGAVVKLKLLEEELGLGF